MANAKQRAILKYDPKSYELAALKSGSLTYDEQLKEYARLRNIANKRLEAFERNKEPHIRRAQAYKDNVGRYRLPASQLTERELRYKLNEVSKFVRAKASSVTGQRRIMEQEIEGLHVNGYNFINIHNYWDFVDFMDKLKEELHVKKIPDSSRVANLFGIAEKLDVKPKDLKKDLNRYLKYYDDIEDFAKDENLENMTSKQIKERIGVILEGKAKEKAKKKAKRKLKKK